MKDRTKVHRAPAAFLQRSELNSRSSDHVKRESGSNLDLSTDHALPPHVLSENKGGDSEWEGGWGGDSWSTHPSLEFTGLDRWVLRGVHPTLLWGLEGIRKDF